MKTYHFILNQFIVSEAALWRCVILTRTRGKVNSIYYFIMQVSKKGKEMKNKDMTGMWVFLFCL